MALPGRLGGHFVSAALAISWACAAWAYQPPPRFLIASSPLTHNIYYARLPDVQEATKPSSDRAVVEAKVLIDGAASKCVGYFCTEDSDRGLRRPHGLALQQGCGTAVLYVSDTEAEDIYAYNLGLSPLGALYAGVQRLVSQGNAKNAQGLAVDGLGNLFFSDAEAGEVRTIPRDQLLGGRNRSQPADVLYSAKDGPSINKPAGVAVDNFFVYWANQAGNTDSGTLGRAPERRAAAQEIPPEPVAVASGPYEAMATNVCLARGNAFFTGTTGALYATPSIQNDSKVTEVVQGFTKPLGCTYDGESTLYVADEEHGVFALAANMGNLRPVRLLNKVVSVQKPDQIVVFKGASTDRCPMISLPSMATRSVATTTVAALVALSAMHS